jgi:hypothetical protein
MAMRSLVLALLSSVLVAMLGTPVHAWSNGPNGPDTFGTHDWIMAKALKATRDGRGTDWVQRRVALRATDDPDTRDGIDHASGTWWHVYDEWGETYGGADEAADVWFRRIRRRFANGNERGASKALGYFAHIIGDISQPMHTDGSDREDRVLPATSPPSTPGSTPTASTTTGSTMLLLWAGSS